MRLASLVLGLALPAVSVACVQERAYLDPNESFDAADYLGSDGLEFTGGGQLSGDIGPVKGFRGSQGVTVEGFDDGVCTYVTITGVGDNGTGFLYVDVMPRVDELPEGSHGINADDVTYEGTLVTAHADTNDGAVFDGAATGGSVTMIKHANGIRELEIRALVDDTDGGETESVGVFRLMPRR